MIINACRNEPTTLTRDTASTCFDAAMARDVAALVRGEAGGQLRKQAIWVRAILSACWQGQVSYEYRRGGHSWFCYNLLETLHTQVHDDIEITKLTELVRERMLMNAWQELPQAKCQEPYLVLEGRPLHLRLATVNSTQPRVPVAKVVPAGTTKHSQKSLPQKAKLESIEDPWTNDLGISFRLIYPGRFAMGASFDDSAASADEQPTLNLTIPGAFWAATFPLTNEVVTRFLENASPKMIPGSPAFRKRPLVRRPSSAGKS